MCLGGNTGVLVDSIETKGVMHGFNRPPLQLSGTETGYTCGNTVSLYERGQRRDRVKEGYWTPAAASDFP